MKISNTNEPEGDFCGTSHAASLLGVSVGTVQALVERNELRAWKTGGGHRRISMQSILDYQKLLVAKGHATPVSELRLKVLVVEDDSAVRSLIQSMVDAWDLAIDCTIVASAMEALICISSLRPDVLITDLKMPGVDGFELLRTLKANPAFSDTHLVALTGLSSEEVAEQGGIPEDAIHVRKPVDMGWLNGYLTALVGAKRKGRV